MLNSENNYLFSKLIYQNDSNTNIGQCESIGTAVSQNGSFFVYTILNFYYLIKK